jgi:Flp pilus assembly protein CpaB
VDVPYARRIGRPTWINARTVLGLVLFTVAFVAGQRLVSAAQTTTGVWAVARDLGSGIVLDESDLTIVDVKLESDQLSSYLLAGETVEGAVLVRPLHAGELVPTSATAAGDGAVPGRSLTIPVAPEHANGGDLRPGDLVDVLGTFGAGSERARTVVLVSGVEVVDLLTAGGLVAGEQSAVGVTVAVTPEDAQRLVFAIRTAEVDVMRVTGGTSLSPTEGVTAEDFE